MSLLKEKIPKSRSDCLVFTSAGDRSNVKQWVEKNRNFDLFVCYYGDKKNTELLEMSEYYLELKGGKFPNLHYIYNNFKEILIDYKYIFVMDDDIIITTDDLNKCFTYMDSYDLWLLQPAFSRLGKVSHLITKSKVFSDLRFTNFVEVTCPLFRAEQLFSFLEEYDPILVGWGVDYWFLHSLGPNIYNKVAIIDSITCVNPTDEHKGGGREIEFLQTKQVRMKIWEEVKTKYNIPQSQHKVFDNKYNYFNIKPIIELLYKLLRN